MSLKHMREAWGLERNPFPAAAIAGEQSVESPYNEDVIADDKERFLEKLVVKAALPPGREFGYLWSQGRFDDTGFGKTTLMLHVARELNTDFGARVAKKFQLPEGTAIAAVWASMSQTGITGIYALLFNAIIYAAMPPAQDELGLIEHCWQTIAAKSGVDRDDKALLQIVLTGITDQRRKLFAGHPEIRQDILAALISCDGDLLLSALEQVTQAARTRNGLAYFEALYCLVRAAGIEHLFVFVDQLEDLAMARNIARATRQREVGRFRDIFAETAGFRGHCHAVFTFHNRAAQALADFWHQERINPPFWPQDPMGRPATVVLTGLSSPEHVERVLATYLDTVRDKPTGTADPFDPSTFQILLERCYGRIGQLLPEAYAILDQAADAEVPTITSQFILENLPGAAPAAEPGDPIASDDDTLAALWKRDE